MSVTSTPPLKSAGNFPCNHRSSSVEYRRICLCFTLGRVCCTERIKVCLPCSAICTSFIRYQYRPCTYQRDATVKCSNFAGVSWLYKALGKLTILHWRSEQHLSIISTFQYFYLSNFSIIPWALRQNKSILFLLHISWIFSSQYFSPLADSLKKSKGSGLKIKWKIKYWSTLGRREKERNKIPLLQILSSSQAGKLWSIYRDNRS